MLIHPSGTQHWKVANTIPALNASGAPLLHFAAATRATHRLIIPLSGTGKFAERLAGGPALPAELA